MNFFQKTYNWILAAIIIIAKPLLYITLPFLTVLLGVLLLEAGRNISKFFILDGNDTVEQYLNSDTKAQVKFKHNICDYGTCLPEIDWYCGFENGEYVIVVACFEDGIKDAPSFMKLDTIRKNCGRKHMAFVGEKYANGSKGMCTKYGGDWGSRNNK